ncbi:MAG: glycoside hydrolase family 3 C-terminal domain-containing protein [Ruminococcus sp.]|nr:glycoside hydrolase family 3 C-terminal domain-containing protein [Ruminococcus sp.]
MRPWENENLSSRECLSPRERAMLLTKELTVGEQAARLSYESPAVSRVGLPAYNWWNEGLHGLARAGTATVFPQAIGLAASFDPDTVKRAAEVTSIEARAKFNAYRDRDNDIYKGLTIWSPNINIFRDPRWGRGHETYGEDPYLTASLGVAYVKGLQGEGKVLRAAACAKHFAVHSGPEALRHEFNAEVSPKDMEETYLPAFKALVKAEVEGVMGAYNRVNGEPACASPRLMEKLREWGFEGYFVSDCWAIRDFHESHHVTHNAVESAAMAIKAGCDLNCGCTYAHLLAALDEGLITKEDIEQACVNTMTTLFKLGMFDKSTEYDNISYEAVCCPEHQAAALAAAKKSVVLLENKGILPLKGVSSIAVIGPNADSRAALEGNYCGRADRYVTFLQGLQEEFNGRIFYSEGCHLYKDRISGLAKPGDRYAEAEECAKAADISLIFTGLDATLEGEEGDTGNEFSSGDKQSLSLPYCQQVLIEKIAAVGKPYIIVNVSGSSINFLPGEGVIQPSAAVQCFYPGAQGGKALAEILTGKISPSGKLPVTFYKSAELLPEFTDYSMKNRTYRYLESGENVLYPFGYGLTYGDFSAELMERETNAPRKSVRVKVKNSGVYDSEDVVQVYIKANDPHAPRNPVLCGFKRVFLKAGEEMTVDVPLDENTFTVVNETGERVPMRGEYELLAGMCSPLYSQNEHSQTERKKAFEELQAMRKHIPDLDEKAELSAYRDERYGEKTDIISH